MPKVEIGSIAMQLNRKAIKNLHISVLPPDGRVRVSAPESMTETAIRMAVISRIPWIMISRVILPNNLANLIEKWLAVNVITCGAGVTV